MTEPIHDYEFDAYVDDALPLHRRMAVEAYLARHPAAAARTMDDLRVRTALRLLPARADDLPETMAAAGARLAAVLAAPRGRRLHAVGRWAAAATVLALASLAIGPEPPVTAAPPSYVSEAVMSYRTGLLRAAMDSQLESMDYDRTEIRARTDIAVPPLPRGWRITDVQIFPSDDGPALQLMIRTPARKQVSIFAVHTREAAPLEPVAIRRGGSSVAYWRSRDIAYALTGPQSPAMLDRAATGLAGQPTN